ncbi:MAG: hypothetical protein CMO66_03010 [Verrucomicrobiales bacterium]|nr:hypothetical protein [Verrucomicrobiales bacterium]
MDISANGMATPRLSPDSAILRAQDAFAAAKAAKARQAASAYAPPAPAAPRPSSAPQSAAVVAQVSQRAGTTAAMLRQNEPNNPLIGLADGIHQSMATAHADPMAAFSEVNDLQNALNFALSGTERLLESPSLKLLE